MYVGLKAEVEKLAAKANNVSDADDLDELEKEIATLQKKLELETFSKSFEEVAAEICKRDGCSNTVALAKARKAYPDLFERYQAGAAPSYPISKATHSLDAVQAFESIVDEIASTRKINRTQAIQIARRQHPVQFEAYQSEK